MRSTLLFLAMLLVSCTKPDLPENPLPLPEGHLDTAIVSVVNYARSQSIFSGVAPLEPFLAELDSYAVSLRAKLDTIQSSDSVVALFKSIVYDQMSISFNPNDQDIATILPHTVAATHQGSCLGTALLFLLLAEKTVQPLSGVLLPGHFFVRYRTDSVQINIEPNRRGWRYTDSEYQQKYQVGEKSWYTLRNLTNNQVAAVLWYNVGNILLDKKEYAKAVFCYRQTTLRFPDFAEALGNRALALKSLGRKKEALVCMQKAIVVRPDLPGAQEALKALR